MTVRYFPEISGIRNVRKDYFRDRKHISADIDALLTEAFQKLRSYAENHIQQMSDQDSGLNLQAGIFSARSDLKCIL